MPSDALCHQTGRFLRFCRAWRFGPECESPSPQLHSNRFIQCRKYPFSIQFYRLLFDSLVISTAVLLSRMSPTRAETSRTLHPQPRLSPGTRRGPLHPARNPETTPGYPHTCSLSLFHSCTLCRSSSEKSEPLTPFFSAVPFHSFHSLLTFFRLTPVFASLTKSIPGYTPPLLFKRSKMECTVPFYANVSTSLFIQLPAAALRKLFTCRQPFRAPFFQPSSQLRFSFSLHLPARTT